MYLEKRVSFDPVRDRDLVEFLDKMTSHKANQLIRELLRSYIKNDRESQLDRIENKINLIVSMATTPTFTHSASAGGGDGVGVDMEVPDEIVINIDSIGV